jgi:L-lactate dehydrogenase complex protein LldF
MNHVLSNAMLFAFLGKLGRRIMKNYPGLVNKWFNQWYNNREMPDPPSESFTEWYKKQVKNG